MTDIRKALIDYAKTAALDLKRPGEIQDDLLKIAGVRRLRVHSGCSTCHNAGVLKEYFHPPHDASPNCESGGRNHCSCDVCF